MIIEYWSDYSCPFCYIAAARMKRAMAEMGISDLCRLDFRAFRLNPRAKVSPQHRMLESFAHGYGIPVEQARKQIDRIESMGRAEGLDFKYGSSWNANTLDALRLTKYAQSQGKALGDAFIDRMYRAFFSDNLVVADHGVLRRMAEECGLDAEGTDAVLESSDFADAVEADERAARMLGLNAVPFFLINGKYGIPGAVDTEDMKRVLQAALDEEDADTGGLSGQACGPDGCR